MLGKKENRKEEEDESAESGYWRSWSGPEEEQLQHETGAQTLTEVVSKSLAVYDFLWTQKQSGAKVLIQDSEGTRELVLL